MEKGGIDIPRLLKFKAFNALGCELYLFSGKFIKKIDLVGKNVYTFNENVPEFKQLPQAKKTKMGFLLHALRQNLNGLFWIRKIIKDHYDVIYSPAAVLDMVFIPYLIKLLGRKIIWVSPLDNIVPITDPGNRFFRFLAWLFFQISLFMLRKADIIFLPTPEIKKYILKRRFPEKKLADTCFAVENELIKKARKIENSEIDALFLGRINETKGIYDMLKVLEIITKKYPDFQLAIMGEGDKITKKNFRKKISEMNLEKNVQFLGFRVGQEKFNIIKSAKCFWFLSVSESESFGMALLEAVCSGIPAFAYDLSQFPRIYQNGEVDISPKGNYKLAAEKVIRLFKRGDFTNEKGKKLLGKYSWEKAAEVEYNAIKNLG
jgi:glycosyltransferase involved in cell wall biosynthesis